MARLRIDKDFSERACWILTDSLICLNTKLLILEICKKNDELVMGGTIKRLIKIGVYDVTKGVTCIKKGEILS